MFYEQTMCRLSRSPDNQDCPDFQNLQVCSDISDFPYVQTLQFLNSKGTDSMTNDQYAITNSQWSMTKWHNLISNLISNLIPIWAWLQRSPFLYDFNVCLFICAVLFCSLLCHREEVLHRNNLLRIFYCCSQHSQQAAHTALVVSRNVFRRKMDSRRV